MRSLYSAGLCTVYTGLVSTPSNHVHPYSNLEQKVKLLVGTFVPRLLKILVSSALNWGMGMELVPCACGVGVFEIYFWSWKARHRTQPHRAATVKSKRKARRGRQNGHGGKPSVSGDKSSPCVGNKWIAFHYREAVVSAILQVCTHFLAWFNRRKRRKRQKPS